MQGSASGISSRLSSPEFAGRALRSVGETTSVIRRLFVPELEPGAPRQLIVLRVLLYIAVVLLSHNFPVWMLVPLSLVAALLAMAYTKSYNATGFLNLNAPAGGSRALYAFSFYGAAALLLVPLVHVVLKPGTLARVALALVLLVYATGLLSAARSAGGRG